MLWLIPGVLPLLVYAGWRRRLAAARLGDPALVSRLSRSLNSRRRRQKSFLLLTGLTLAVIAAARPQYGAKVKVIERKGVDVIVALDVSRSMLAEDVKPSRLARAKSEISTLIEKLKGDRIGLVAFAGDAFVQCPLTLDYSAARMLLDATDTYTVPEPGTALGEAISVSSSLFPRQSNRGKALVLITDGEDHLGGEIEAAREAASTGVKIYCIGVGSARGSPIPIRDSGGNLVEYKKDDTGGSVISKLNVQTLQAIATISEGSYHASTAGQIELDVVLDDIDKLEKSLFGGREFTEAEERYQYFLLPALLLMMVSAFLSDRRREEPEVLGYERAVS
jgi:Ca-activated chloride channel family protein